MKTPITKTIHQVVAKTPVFDIHTHLFDPAFGKLMLWGIDELLTYHYLIAEGFRYFKLPYEKFWRLSQREQADMIWNALFIENSPISESCRGVLTVLHKLGFDVKKRDLPALRKHCAKWNAGDFVTRSMEVANVRKICMTNSPFEEDERRVWERGFRRDERFVAALRIDPLLNDWNAAALMLHQWGYAVSADFSGKTITEVRRFLGEWTSRIQSQYCMVSLPPDFRFPEQSPRARLIEQAVLPHCREHGQPFAMMIGCKRGVNPALRLAGDSLGLAAMSPVECIAAQFPDNKFLVTMLARENQHELCVTARKFRNLHVFGCWWFMNNPVLIEEITRMRLELIGLSVTPQHSDARVLDQIIYKWDHSRTIIAKVLAEKYADLAATGWKITTREIERDVAKLLGGGFEAFLKS